MDGFFFVRLNFRRTLSFFGSFRALGEEVVDEIDEVVEVSGITASSDSILSERARLFEDSKSGIGLCSR